MAVISSPWYHDLCNYFSPLFHLVSWYWQSWQSSFLLGIMIFAIISVLSSTWCHDICNRLRPLFPFGVMILAIMAVLSFPWCYDIYNHHSPHFPLVSWYLQSSKSSLPLCIMIFAIISVLSFQLSVIIFAIVSVLSAYWYHDICNHGSPLFPLES